MHTYSKRTSPWHWKRVLIGLCRILSLQADGARKQSIDDRRAGYVASTVLAGETETRVQVETLVIDGLTFRVFSPLNVAETLPCALYYHGGCFVSGGFATHDNQLRQLAFTVSVG